jgi:hypothetical protein
MNNSVLSQIAALKTMAVADLKHHTQDALRRVTDRAEFIARGNSARVPLQETPGHQNMVFILLAEFDLSAGSALLRLGDDDLLEDISPET